MALFQRTALDKEYRYLDWYKAMLYLYNLHIFVRFEFSTIFCAVTRSSREAKLHSMTVQMILLFNILIPSTIYFSAHNFHIITLKKVC
jgi:hypothetical protein